MGVQKLINRVIADLSNDLCLRLVLAKSQNRTIIIHASLHFGHQLHSEFRICLHKYIVKGKASDQTPTQFKMIKGV